MTEDMKKVYSPEEIKKILGLGKSKTYAFLEQVLEDKKPFKVIKIGRQYRILPMTSN